MDKNLIQSQNLTILFDLDDTLIISPYNVPYPRARPYLYELLEFCFTHFGQVGIFTAAHKEWLTCCLAIVLTPMLNKIRMTLQRKDYCFYPIYHHSHCVMTEDYITIKPLSIVWDAGIATADTTLIVDDTPETFELNPDNAILVPRPPQYPFITDDTLSRLITYLKQVIEQYTEIGSVVKINNFDKFNLFLEMDNCDSDSEFNLN